MIVEKILFLALGLLLIDGFRTPRRQSPIRCASLPAQGGTDPTYDVAAWQAGWTTCEKEIAADLPGGNVPLDLDGTYFRNGHAKYESGSDKVMHPFDADGLVSAITIRNGKCTFRNRFVATEGYRKEKRYKKIMYRGSFGTKKSGGFFANAFDLKQKNVANTNCIFWAGRLLALWEGGLPHRMEPDSLRTLGTYRFKGLLKKGDTFSAHPRFDSKSGRMINFSTKQGGIGPSTVTVFEFEEGSVTPCTKRSFQLTSPLVFFHDFIVTSRYYVFDEAPISLDNPLPFILGAKGPAECIAFDQTKPAVVYLVPRDPSDLVIHRVEVPTHFSFHFANAYDGPDNSVVFDVVKSDNLQLGETSKSTKPIWESIDYSKEVPVAKLYRITLTPKEKNISDQWSVSLDKLSDTQVEFPSVAAHVGCSKHRFVYASCGSDPTSSTPVQGIIKVDTENPGAEVKWMPQRHEFLGECIFVKRTSVDGPTRGSPEEDDGYVLSFLFNGKEKTTEFVIFDAQKISVGPISRQILPVKVPFGLHGTFAPKLMFEPEDILRKHKAALALESKQWGEMTGGFSGLGIVYDLKDY